MKRILSSVLLAAMLLGITACGNTPAAPADTADTAGASDTTAPAETTSAEPETTADPLADNLPDDVNYNGYAFRIGATSQDPQWINYLIRTEQKGEVLNDTIYAANNAVAERFGITFKHIPYKGTNHASYSEILASARAGDDNVDILTLHDLRSGQATLQGVFRNVYELEHVDFEKPWWPRFTVNALTINGKMYNISNSMSYYNIYAVRLLMFNKGLMKNLGITFPYDDVRAGTWYLDDLINMTKDVYSDVDTDGKRSANDRYGIAITGTPYCFLECFGVDVYGRDEKNLIKDDFYTERTVRIVETTNTWFNGGNAGAYFAGSGDALKMFAGGNVLFTFRGLGQIVNACMESEVEYGMLPMPKLDENQEEYISGTVDNPISVPITNNNMDRTGMIIEAMSAEGYRRVQPVFTETVMKGRYASDKDSVEMLNIVFNNRMLAAGYLFANSDKTYRLQTVHDDMWRQGTSNINLTSHYEKVKSQFRGYIDTINEFYARTEG